MKNNLGDFGLQKSQHLQYIELKSKNLRKNPKECGNSGWHEILAVTSYRLFFCCAWWFDFFRALRETPS